MALLAAVSGSDLVNAVVWIIVAGIIFWLLTFLIDYLKIPEPFNRVARVILIVVAVLFLINLLLMLVGKPIVKF